MMKKTVAILLVLLMVLMAGFACAEGANKLNAFADRLKSAAEKQATTEVAEETAVPDKSYGPALVVNDPFYQKVRSSAYLREDKYSREAYVMIELKNISGRTLYPDQISITAMSASGEVLGERPYGNCGPTMVENGASLFIWDRFYNLEAELSQIDHFEVKVESDTSSYREYATIDGQAMVIGGIAYALVENTLEADIYGVDATICIENEAGDLLDVCKVDTGNAVGVFPGSVMVLRANAKDYAANCALMEGTATAYVTYEKE